MPIISSMGAGNKLDGSQFKVADIYKTKVCPLAKVMRRELKKRGVRKTEGRIFRRSSDTSDRRYVDQLPDALYLSAGGST